MATEDDPNAAPTKENAANDEENTSSKPADATPEPEAAPADAGNDKPSVKPDDEDAKEAASDAAESDAAEGAAADSDAADGEATESDAADAAAAESAEAAVPGPTPAPVQGAAWAEPIAKFERRWTWLETRLLTFVLIWELASLVLWVLLSGLAIQRSADAGGVVFRSLIAAVLLGIGGWVGTSKLPLEKRRVITMTGVVVGVCIGLVLRPPFDATGGIRLAINKALGLDRVDAAIVAYFGNVKGWLQEASTLTLMGGLRGVATRLTLWLALLGASLATASGKHIHIDVIFRFLPIRFRVPAAIVNFTAAALVCVAGAWGFIDYLAIESFNAKAEDTAGTKMGRIVHHMGQHAFLTRKQIGLDLQALPHVLKGENYSKWMSAAEWNQWVKEGGFDDNFKPEQIAGIMVPADAGPHSPLVVPPNGEAAPGLLVHSLNFVFPFGLLAIALRFILRAVLTISGHVPVDPDAAHKEELHGASGETAKAGGV